MPSTHQTNQGGESYEDEPKKMVATKTDATLAALVRGIRDPDRARRYIEAEVELAEREGREPRRDLIGMVDDRLADIDGDE